MSSELCVFDLGFSWSKGKKKNKIYVQPSIYGEAKPVFEENIKQDDFVFNDDLFVGKLALRHSDIKYFSLNDNKTEAMTSNVLMKTGLGYLNSSNPFNLVTGLPVKFYFTQREHMMSLIEGLNEADSYKIKKGKNKTNNIKINIDKYKIVPQGYGIAMDFLLTPEGKISNSGIAKKKILVIDLGFYTLNLLGLDKMEIMKESTSIILGVEKAYKLLQTYLQKAVGKSPAIYEMDTCVIEGRYEGRDIRLLIQKAFRPLSIQIQNEVESLNINFDYHLIGGGAAHNVFEQINLPNKILFDQLSQIRGYENVGVRLWK
ncbi:hypothetical protein GRF59_14325 [Paenibacillus sp. HJL G12]|uniref:Actin-like protein N-terminal domain-containing protein n=1 Tax=Paenibacillus dendrobii TaxID=2691084 RepID=A0A7X3IIW2_9BACL|nr:ParM/StbA family protein [Paenibacillus dendrobii]MWV44793.1 hypothetical protein [Paenibacillus dendrobii]